MLLLKNILRKVDLKALEKKGTSCQLAWHLNFWHEVPINAGFLGPGHNISGICYFNFFPCYHCSFSCMLIDLFSSEISALYMLLLLFHNFFILLFFFFVFS